MQPDRLGWSWVSVGNAQPRTRVSVGNFDVGLGGWVFGNIDVQTLTTTLLSVPDRTSGGRTYTVRPFSVSDGKEARRTS